MKLTFQLGDRNHKQNKQVKYIICYIVKNASEEKKAEKKDKEGSLH